MTKQCTKCYIYSAYLQRSCRESGCPQHPHHRKSDDLLDVAVDMATGYVIDKAIESIFDSSPSRDSGSSGGFDAGGGGDFGGGGSGGDW